MRLSKQKHLELFRQQKKGFKMLMSGTSLVVQWLRLRAASAGGLGSIPGQGTRPHMPQLQIPRAATKNLHVVTKECLNAPTKT